jgi:hypothetical protein
MSRRSEEGGDEVQIKSMRRRKEGGERGSDKGGRA